jgi:calcineurin-like phosphoesterase family protein
MGDFFTADLHLGHRRIIELCDRPFRDVAHMFAVFEQRWRERVTGADRVYLLGDIAMGDAAANLARFASLPGHKIVVPGNHDKCFPDRSDAADWVQRYEDLGYEVAATSLEVSIGDTPVTLCHFPPGGESRPGREDRYAQWRPVTDGWVVHGHVHTLWQVRGRHINVGVDQWGFAPVAAAEISSIIDAGA